MRSPADMIQMSEIVRLQKSQSQDQPAFAFSFPRNLGKQLAAEAAGSADGGVVGFGGSGGSYKPSGRGAAAAAAGRAKWVHCPLNDLWRLALNAKGVLEWVMLEPSGQAPYPRSRHTMEAVPTRGLAIVGRPDDRPQDLLSHPPRLRLVGLVQGAVLLPRVGVLAHPADEHLDRTRRRLNGLKSSP